MSIALLLRHRLPASVLLLFALSSPRELVLAQQATKVLNPGTLELVISGPREDFPDRQLIRSRMFKTTLINHSTRPVVFGPNAPRASGQYDLSNWHVADPTGNPAPYRPRFIFGGGAHKTSPNRRLTDKNLFVIKPGESWELGEIDLSDWFVFSETGEYKIYCEFSFSPPRLTPVITSAGTKSPAEFDASAMSPARRRMLRNAPGFSVASNVWILHVKGL